MNNTKANVLPADSDLVREEQEVIILKNGSALTRFWARVKKAFSVESERDQMEAYLSQSTDIYDLEERMRKWDGRNRLGGGSKQHWYN